MGVSVVFWILVGVDVVNWGLHTLAPHSRGGLCIYVESHIFILALTSRLIHAHPQCLTFTYSCDSG